MLMRRNIRRRHFALVVMSSMQSSKSEGEKMQDGKRERSAGAKILALFEHFDSSKHMPVQLLQARV